MSDVFKDNARIFWGPLFNGRFSPANTTHLEAMDSELVILREMMNRALRLRNELTWSCKLPSEVRILIVLFLRDDWPPRRRWARVEQQYKFQSGWMAVTHVCSHWRTLTLEAPILWAAHPDLKGIAKQFIPTILAWSKTCPLDLQANVLEKEHLDLLLRWLGRLESHDVRRLHLGWDRSGYAPFVELLTRVSPYLRGLQFLHLNIDCEDAFELPKHISNVSSMTHLSLAGFHFPWDAPMFSHNLQHLSLETHRNPLRTRPKYSELQALLSNLRSLRTLELNGVIPLDISSETIQLSETLQRFDYIGSHDRNLEALQFIARVRLPCSCTTKMILYSSHDESSGVNPLVGACLAASSIFGSEGFCGPAELYYAPNHITVFAKEEGLRLRKTPRVFPSGGLQSHSSPGRDIRFIDLAHSMNFENYLEFLPLSNLQAITIFNLQSNKILSLFDRLAPCALRIRRAGIWLRECLPLVHALMDLADDGFALFPKLETLVLHSSPVDDMKLFIELTALETLVKLRKSEGSPLREIAVCQNTEGWGIWDAVKDDVQVTFL
ncbi:hypothetical protein PENSPDRAFT_754487 [Peniophora sp. CONT]|nr:hypothetical protein PENSPDRAFT_754487 [Peniophora sp. CONT]